MSRVLSIFLFLSTFPLSAQYQFLRLNNLRELRVAAPLYQSGADYHTGIKPLNLWQMDSSGMSPEAWMEPLCKPKESWLGRKLWNEHLAYFRDANVYLTIDPVVNFQGGFETFGTQDFLYVNTRGFNLEGRLGNHFSFQSSYLENQATFPAYIYEYTQRREVVPGQGFARDFKDKGYDYGMASGEVSYTPNHFFSFTLGQGRNFFGEGHRSMLLSDVAYNYPFLRIETSFWKIKYVNLWGQMYDLRRGLRQNGAYAKKYFSSHYLSINITPRWNFSLFEAIIIGDTAQQRGVDIAFFNPVIFYRPIEFAVGSGQGNALLGAGSSYKLADGLQVYGQFLLDEFNLDALTNGNGSWVNKYSWQLGAKWYSSFGVEGLFTRLEYNASRPYTYSHRDIITNYAHYGQPLAHPWGGNFQEGIVQVVYQRSRWEASARFHLGLIGLDTDSMNWGSNIFRSYDDHRQELGNEVGQGESGRYQYLEARLAYLINPASALKLEAGLRLRNLEAADASMPLPAGQSQYFFVGLRTGFFNRYYDF